MRIDPRARHLIIPLCVAALWIGIQRAQRTNNVAPPRSSTTEHKSIDHRRFSRQSVPAIRHISGRGGRSAPNNIKRQSDYQRRDLIEDEFILQFGSDADLAAFLEYAEEYGLEILDRSKNNPAILLRIENEYDWAELVDYMPIPFQYSNNYYTRQPDPPRPPDPADVALDTADPARFGRNALQFLGKQSDSDFDGHGITVAILDTGVSTHRTMPDTHITQIDLVDQSANATGDNYGHGTAVASIIAGSSESVTGVAPKVDLLSVRVLQNDGTGDVFTLAEGIFTAVERGADIINLSLGTYGDVRYLQAAVDYAVESGVIIVASTGNDGLVGVTFPARYAGVVAVTGIDALERRPTYANTGDDVDIAAPAVGVVAAWTGKEDPIVSFGGTSAAVPFVVGALAGVLSDNPNLSGEEAVETVMTFSNDAGSPDWDEEYGNGILNIGRIQDRNERGIYDAAVAGHYVEPVFNENDSVALIVAVENRGTETIGFAEVKTVIDGVPEYVPFSDIAPGETKSIQFAISREHLEESPEITVTSTVTITDVDDQNARNNGKTSVIVYQTPPEIE